MDTLELLQLKVKDVMTTNLVVVSPDKTLADVDLLLRTHDIHHIPVVNEDGLLEGILTKNDLQLMKNWSTDLGLPSSKRQNDQVLNSHRASDKMQTYTVQVSPDDTLQTCAEIFKANLFHALPVTQHGVLLGMVTTYDLLKVAYSKNPLLTLNT